MILLIYKPRADGTYLSYIYEATDFGQDSMRILNDIDKDPNHTGGYEELKQKISELIFSYQQKAAKAAGLGDRITIKSILNRLEGMIYTLALNIRKLSKKHAPQIKRIVDTLCNAIMDAIDYIKREFE